MTPVVEESALGLKLETAMAEVRIQSDQDDV